MLLPKKLLTARLTLEVRSWHLNRISQCFSDVVQPSILHFHVLLKATIEYSPIHFEIDEKIERNSCITVYFESATRKHGQEELGTNVGWNVKYMSAVFLLKTRDALLNSILVCQVSSSKFRVKFGVNPSIL